MTRGRSNADHTIHIESAGNARIVDRRGDVVAVMESWQLFVNGNDALEVDNYREAIVLTERILSGKVVQ